MLRPFTGLHLMHAKNFPKLACLTMNATASRKPERRKSLFHLMFKQLKDESTMPSLVVIKDTDSIPDIEIVQRLIVGDQAAFEHMMR